MSSRRTALVALMVVAVLTTACSDDSGSSGGLALDSGSSTTKTTESSREADEEEAEPTPTPDSDPEELAIRSALAPEDLGDGWIECCPPVFYGPEDLDLHTCSAPPDLPDFKAAHQREYSLNPTPDGLQEAGIFGGAFIADSSQAADAEFAVSLTPEYRECRIDEVTTDVASRQAPILAGPVETTADLQSFDGLGVPATLIRLISSFDTRAGGRALIATDILQMQVGQVMHRIQLRSYDEQPSSDFMLCVAASVVERSKSSLSEAPPATNCTPALNSASPSQS